MTSAAPRARRHDSADSRARLLESADELFSEQGYEATTVREIGARAGVDPALIARYYGSKAELYLAAIRREGRPGADGLSLDDVLDRVLTRGPSPTQWAMVRQHADPALQDAAKQIMERAVLENAEQRAADAGLDDARLRAELVAAALTGIVLCRSAGALPTLAGADRADVARLAGQLLTSLLDPPT